MTTAQSPDPLSDLASSLSLDYTQSRVAQLERAMAELEQLIQRVPEQREFTNSRRYKVRGPIFTLICLGFLGGAIHQAATGWAACLAGMILLFALITWQHRDAGQHPFMCLTRTQLFADTLSAPINLVDITDMSVSEEGMLTVQKFTLRPNVPLPAHRAVRTLFGNQALALTKPQPHIRILSAGLMSNGRNLSCDHVAAMLYAHWQAAQAQQQLDALRQDA
ncbi:MULTISPECIES: hypothetical protein [unclassified Pseudomonas]|uniref:hypothetical protein n=1 Tax=unclassified Pseudomonas TaxID=196821 RepID=UPI0025F2C9AA|nr:MULTISPECIES: hypothetical protein [unclassified Pseudomonas]